MASTTELKILWDHLQRAHDFLNTYILGRKNGEPDFFSFKTLFTFLSKKKNFDFSYQEYSGQLNNLFDKSGAIIDKKASKKTLVSWFNSLLEALDELILEKKQYSWNVSLSRYLPLAEKQEFKIPMELLLKMVGVYVGFFNLDNKKVTRFVFSISPDNSILLKSHTAESTGMGGMLNNHLWFNLFSEESKTPELIIADIRNKLQKGVRLDSFTAVSTWFDAHTSSPVCAATYLKRVKNDHITGAFDMDEVLGMVETVEAAEIEAWLVSLGPTYFKLEKPDR